MKTRVAWFLVLVLLCVTAVQAMAQQTTIILVRHAEKADGPAGDPPLTQLGEARAQRLAESLVHAGVSAIFSTDTKRTQDTASPLSKKLGIAVTLTPIKAGVARYATDLAARIRTEHKGKTVVVVGHSNTTPDLIKALGAAAVPAITDPEYDNLYVVTLLEDGKALLIRARY